MLGTSEIPPVSRVAGSQPCQPGLGGQHPQPRDQPEDKTPQAGFDPQASPEDSHVMDVIAFEDCGFQARAEEEPVRRGESEHECEQQQFRGEAVAVKGSRAAEPRLADLAAHLAGEVQPARARAELLSLRTVRERLAAWRALHGKLPPRGRWIEAPRRSAPHRRRCTGSWRARVQPREGEMAEVRQSAADSASVGIQDFLQLVACLDPSRACLWVAPERKLGTAAVGPKPCESPPSLRAVLLSSAPGGCLTCINPDARAPSIMNPSWIMIPTTRPPRPRSGARRQACACWWHSRSWASTWRRSTQPTSWGLCPMYCSSPVR